MKIAALLSLLLSLTLPASAIELSLEENKAERGNIGYIDMQRLFKTFPDTLRARENFEELVRQAEEQLNLRKAEMLRLRNELSQLRIQRDFVSKTPIEVVRPQAKAQEAAKPAAANPAVERMLQSERAEPPPPAASEPAAPVEPAAPAAQPPAPDARRQREPETDLTRPSIATLPGFAAAEPKREPLVINIPGVSTAPIVVQPPEAPPAPPVEPAPAATISTQTAAIPAEPPPGNPALVELDAKVALKGKELAARELEFKEQQAAAEKNLLDIESRKTEVLLGKIHRAVQEVARREGVSVVVDKNSILYGHDAVDLTEKVMKFLK